MLALALAGAGCNRVQTAALARPGGQQTGLFTTLPLLWPERESVRDLLRSSEAPHWALATIRQHGPIVPLDNLLDRSGGSPFADIGLLVMAQPRPLSPQENVALDCWVRRGGHLLLFADPMLTAESAYALGDKRRPQDVVLLSPILARWGLRLEFDEEQPAGERLVESPAGNVPVNLPGNFALSGQGAGCRIEAAGLIARCTIGRGTVLAVADAAMLEGPEDDEPARRAALLSALLQVTAAN